MGKGLRGKVIRVRVENGMGSEIKDEEGAGMGMV